MSWPCYLLTSLESLRAWEKATAVSLTLDLFPESPSTQIWRFWVPNTIPILFFWYLMLSYTIPEGPSIQHLGTLVPKTMKGMAFGNRNLICRVRGPFGIMFEYLDSVGLRAARPARKDDEPSGQLPVLREKETFGPARGSPAFWAKPRRQHLLARHIPPLSQRVQVP